VRILYLGCHSINEYEDIKLFSELGHEIVAMGAYNNPSNSGDDSRPALPGIYHNPEMAKLAANLVWNYERTSVIPDELINWCDAIYILGIQVWLPFNWEHIKKKIVIFRSIGQSIQTTENVLRKYRREGLKIVRYSPLERRIPGYAGEDAMIRFYKDEDEYKDWNGEVEKVITVAQSMKKRDPATHFYLFEKATRGLPRTLYGTGNEDVGELWGGKLTYEQLKQAYRDNRVFFYTGTHPAQYTMAFQEAFMCFTGETRVATPEVLQVYEREYSGPLIRLESDNGLECECTPNHPFLTIEGWKMAKDINAGSTLYATTYGWNKDLDSAPITDLVERIQAERCIKDCENDWSHWISRLCKNEKTGSQDAFWSLLENEVDIANRVRTGVLNSDDRWRGDCVNSVSKVYPWEKEVLSLRGCVQHISSLADISEERNPLFWGLYRQTETIRETSCRDLYAQGLNLLPSIQKTVDPTYRKAKSDVNSACVDRETFTDKHLLRVLRNRYGTHRCNSLVKPERIRKIRKTHATNIKVYNLRTRTGVYFANGLLAHNCGMPIVSIGRVLAGFDLEVADFIENGVNGFTSDNLRELREYVKLMLKDYDYAKRISGAAGEKAIELFSKHKIKEEWRKFFQRVIGTGE